MNATPPVSLLVLDIHGVVLNGPLVTFLADLAAAARLEPQALVTTWYSDVRYDAWTGAVDESTMWARLGLPDPSSDRWRHLLEQRYAPGPAAPELPRWSARVPTWALSNHRSEWLHPRLKRFGLAQYFDRILVSDAIGALKPESAAFAPVLASGVEPSEVLVVDDRARNIAAARAHGFQTVHATGSSWLERIERRLYGHLHLEVVAR